MNFKNLVFISLLNLFLVNAVSAQEEAKSKKTFNIHTNPITWLIGIYSIGVDVAVNNKLTLGGSYNHVDFSAMDLDENGQDIDANANGFGVRMQYFLNEAFHDGWYLTGFGDFGKGEVKNNDTSEFANLKSTSLGFTAGYFWIWENFNIQLGLGLQNSKINLTDSSLSAQDREDIEDLEGVRPTGDFRLGLAF